jgi:UDP-glucose:(heptosyl)LPS alpha-1,3-glucosyltransferase
MFADPRLRAVICISELVRDDIRRFYGVPEQKLHVIYNGIDLDRYHPRLATEHRSEVRRQYGIRIGTVVYLRWFRLRTEGCGAATRCVRNCERKK